MSGISSAVLRQALDYPNPDDRIRVIKSQVARQFASVDRRTNVTFTEYFNHSFAPDIVLSWPLENRERLVFLRPNSDPSWIADDLRLLTPSRPIIMTLESTPDMSWEAAAQLSQVAQESDTLLTDMDGVDEIRAGQHPVVDLLAHALLRGGRGILNEGTSRNVASLTVTGFDGAQQLVEHSTRAAVDVLAAMLEPAQSGRMTRVLQAVWEGHGGSSATFPGQPGLSGPLTPDDLSLLLQAVDTEDVQFWRQIGRTLTLSQLSDLNVADPSANLQRLVAANLDRLYARALRVLDQPAYLGEPEDAPRWKIEHRCLCLRGWGWAAYLATSKEQLPRETQSPSVRVQELRDRAQAANLLITNVQVRRTDLAITLESTTEDSIIDSSELDELTHRPDAMATSATVTLPGGRRLICDLATATANGHTNATYDVHELGTYALPLLLDLPPDELAGIREIFTRLSRTEDPGLFELE